MALKFANNAESVLASSINSTQTSIVLQAGQGARFPTLAPGDYFLCTLADTLANLEIVRVTARTADTLTVIRGQEGTTARAYVAGSYIGNQATAGALSTFFNTDNDGAGSGLDADLLDGRQSSATAVANTIPVRDANGDLPGNITGNAATATWAATATLATNAEAANVATTTAVATDNSNATRFLAFVAGISGNRGTLANSSATYNPSTNTAGLNISGIAAVATLAENGYVFYAIDTGSLSSSHDKSASVYNPVAGLSITLPTITGNLRLVARLQAGFNSQSTGAPSDSASIARVDLAINGVLLTNSGRNMDVYTAPNVRANNQTTCEFYTTVGPAQSGQAVTISVYGKLQDDFGNTASLTGVVLSAPVLFLELRKL